MSVPALTWTGSTWAVAGGTVSNTPSVGAEKIVNGGFDSDTIWVKDALWTISGGLLHATGVAQYTSTYQSSILNIGTWYRYSLDVLNNTLGNLFFQEGSNTTIKTTSGNGNFTGCYRSIVGGEIRLKSTDALTTLDVDNVSFLPLTLSTLFRSLVLSTPDVLAEVAITRTAGTQAGLVLNLDSAATPANFIIVYLDSAGNCIVDECVAGVYTNKQTTAVTYGADKILTAEKRGTSLLVTYGGTKVGATLTMSANTNTLCGLFDTYGNFFSKVNVSPL